MVVILTYNFSFNKKTLYVSFVFVYNYATYYQIQFKYIFKILLHLSLP